MKGVLGLIVLVFGGLALAYYGGAFSMEDPAKAAKRIHDGVEPGMSWREVAAVKEPRKIYEIMPETSAGKGDAGEYTPDRLQGMLDEDSLPDGFLFEYRFSAQEAVGVYFDPEGTVVDVRDLFTEGDLYEGKLPGMQ